MISKNDYQELQEYKKRNDLYPVKGADAGKLNDGDTYGSMVNKLHLIKVVNSDPDEEKAYADKSLFSPKTFVDLCKMEFGACQYDAEDFLYCKNLGFPINRLITLRRFPFPCTDNIYDLAVQPQPDVARMVTYFSQDINKMEDILTMVYGMKWKELTAEMEQAGMQGDQSGFSGYMKNIMKLFDGQLASNVMAGENTLQYNPKHDGNKVFGPVDSIINTHIRDVGLDFEKEFDITFDYTLRSISGRTPEYAMKDIIANVLACTFNNGKFWGGSRFWVGDRPSKFFENFAYMNSTQVDDFLYQSFNHLKSGLKAFGDTTGAGAVDMLKQVLKNGMAMAIGKMLDKVGRPSILMMDSLLNNEPTGYWHLTIGSPDNPIICIGNLLCTGTEISFPTDSLSWGGFPTKMQFKVKLKPGMAKDRAGMEMMFNMGRKRIYYAPKTIEVSRNKNVLSKTTRSFFGFDTKNIETMAAESFDFLKEDTKVTIKEVVEKVVKTPKPSAGGGGNSESSSSRNILLANAEL